MYIGQMDTPSIVVLIGVAGLLFLWVLWTIYCALTEPTEDKLTRGVFPPDDDQWYVARKHGSRLAFKGKTPRAVWARLKKFVNTGESTAELKARGYSVTLWTQGEH